MTRANLRGFVVCFLISKWGTWYLGVKAPISPRTGLTDEAWIFPFSVVQKTYWLRAQNLILIIWFIRSISGSRIGLSATPRWSFDGRYRDFSNSQFMKEMLVGGGTFSFQFQEQEWKLNISNQLYLLYKENSRRQRLIWSNIQQVLILLLEWFPWPPKMAILVLVYRKFLIPPSANGLWILKSCLA